VRSEVDVAEEVRHAGGHDEVQQEEGDEEVEGEAHRAGGVGRARIGILES